MTSTQLDACNSFTQARYRDTFSLIAVSLQRKPPSTRASSCKDMAASHLIASVLMHATTQSQLALQTHVKHVRTAPPPSPFKRSPLLAEPEPQIRPLATFARSTTPPCVHHASTMRPPRVRHAARTPRGSLSPLGHQPLLFHSASVLTRDCRAITNRTNYEPSHYCTASSNSVGSKDVHCGGAEGAEMTQSVGRKALELGSTRSDRTCSTLLRALRASAVNAFGLVMATTEPATTDPRTTAEPMIGFC